MDGLLAPMGVTTRQWLLLAVLSRSDRPLSLTEAAARYGSSRQNVKSIALGLERAGYLRLDPDPADARTIRIHLCDAVRRFDEPAAAAQGSGFLAEVFAGLDADDLDVLDAAHAPLADVGRGCGCGSTRVDAGLGGARHDGSSTHEPSIT